MIVALNAHKPRGTTLDSETKLGGRFGSNPHERVLVEVMPELKTIFYWQMSQKQKSHVACGFSKINVPMSWVRNLFGSHHCFASNHQPTHIIEHNVMRAYGTGN